MPGLACYYIQVGTGMPKYKRDLNIHLSMVEDKDQLIYLFL